MINTLLIIDIEIITIVILVYYLHVNNNRYNKRSPTLRAVTSATTHIIGMLILEAIIFTLETNMTTKAELEIAYFLRIVYYLSSSVAAYLSYVFLYAFSFRDTKEIPKSEIIKQGIILVVYFIIMYIMNEKTHLLYNITFENGYDPSYLQTLYILPSIIYFFMIQYVLVKHARKNIDISQFQIALLYLLAVTSCCTIQNALNNVILTGPAYGLAMVCIYSLVINQITTIDKLTGATNRRTFNNLLDGLGLKNNTEFSLAFIDLDNLKKINDTYGHAEGDVALLKLVEIVENSIHTPDIIARMGGDEFVILFNTTNRSIIEGKMQEIEENRKKYNEEAKKEYELSFSISYEIYNKEKFESAYDLLKYVDNKMYEVKYKRKNKETEIRQF